MHAGNEIFGHLSGEPVERIRLTGGGLTAHVLTWGLSSRIPRLAGHDAPLVLGYEDLPSYLAHSPISARRPAAAPTVSPAAASPSMASPISSNATSAASRICMGAATAWAGRTGALRIRAAISSRWPSPILPAAPAIPALPPLPAPTALPATACSVVYEATADAPTPVNLCQHSYFNLDGSADAFGLRNPPCRRSLPARRRQASFRPARSAP